MHQYHPDRPKIGTMPAFFPHGQIRGVIPALSIYLLPGMEFVEVSGFFCKTTTTASRLSAKIPFNELPQFLTSWFDDPERIALEHFQYSIEETVVAKLSLAKPKTPTLTLADLGDLEF